MRDKSHKEQIERWAEYVKTHSYEDWKGKVKPFIDAQILMARRFYEKLGKTKKGRDKIKQLRNI